MNSVYRIVVVLTAIAMIGSTGASLGQQASALVDPNVKQKFTELTDDFERAVLDAAAIDPPEPDKIQSLLDQYYSDVMKAFGLPLIKGDSPGELEPPDPDRDSPIAGDPPGEADPPTELDPPEPDKS